MVDGGCDAPDVVCSRRGCVCDYAIMCSRTYQVDSLVYSCLVLFDVQVQGTKLKLSPVG